jgi:hypothetical protein
MIIAEKGAVLWRGIDRGNGRNVLTALRLRRKEAGRRHQTQSGQRHFRLRAEVCDRCSSALVSETVRYDRADVGHGLVHARIAGREFHCA